MNHKIQFMTETKDLWEQIKGLERSLNPSLFAKYDYNISMLESMKIQTNVDCFDNINFRFIL